MYLWRKITPEQREEILFARKAHKRPWHSPPRWADDTKTLFHLSATCFEHAHFIGKDVARMDEFTAELLATLGNAAKRTFAWCVLSNHYHLLVETHNLRETTQVLGKHHGRTSYRWNDEDNQRGRKCFQRISDRAIRSDRHFWATMNYIHNNAVHHGYVEKWTDWPWTSAHDFLAGVGRDEALRIWREYPVLDYGAKWDARSPSFKRNEPPLSE